jgi:hypothetical protein
MGLLDDLPYGLLNQIRNAAQYPNPNVNSDAGYANDLPPWAPRQPQRAPLSFAGPELTADIAASSSAPRWHLSASGPGIRHRPFMATRQLVRRPSSRAATGTASAKPDHAGPAHERRTRGRHRRGGRKPGNAQTAHHEELWSGFCLSSRPNWIQTSCQQR